MGLLREQTHYKNYIKKYNYDENYIETKYYLSNDNWGLDECYSSDKISSYHNQNEIYYLKELSKFWFPNRIDLDGGINDNFILDKVSSGLYSELTTKNYFEYENKIKEIVSNINNFNI